MRIIAAITLVEECGPPNLTAASPEAAVWFARAGGARALKLSSTRRHPNGQRTARPFPVDALSRKSRTSERGAGIAAHPRPGPVYQYRQSVLTHPYACAGSSL